MKAGDRIADTAFDARVICRRLPTMLCRQREIWTECILDPFPSGLAAMQAAKQDMNTQSILEPLHCGLAAMQAAETGVGGREWHR